MDKHRIKSILTSPKWIDVTFNGESISVDELDESSNTALIHELETGKVLRVEVNQLQEEG